jgi:exonuclease III
MDATRADIVCLQETKMQSIPRRIMLSMLGSDFEHSLVLPSVGASGGILLAWRCHLRNEQS